MADSLPQVEIVDRLKEVFDKPEVLELLDRLHDEGFLLRDIDERLELADCADEVAIGATTEEEGRGVYWSLIANHPWWQIHR